MTALSPRVPAPTTRRLAALVWLALVGCEPRADSAQPQPQPTAPAPTPAPAEPEAPPQTDPLGPDYLPEVAGVHYLEFVTGDADPESELVMIVAIHGLGDRPESFASLLREFKRPARVIVPRALDANEPGWSWFPIRARDPDVEGLAKGIVRAADTLAPAIAELVELRPTKGKPIVTGFSQGGMLSFTLAVRHGELFSAAYPVGGWLPPPLWPTAKAKPDAPPIVAFHGDEDKAVALEPTQLAVDELKRQGYAVDFHVYVGVGHKIVPEMFKDLMLELRGAVDRVAAE